MEPGSGRRERGDRGLGQCLEDTGRGTLLLVGNSRRNGRWEPVRAGKAPRAGRGIPPSSEASSTCLGVQPTPPSPHEWGALSRTCIQLLSTNGVLTQALALSGFLAWPHPCPW